MREIKFRVWDGENFIEFWLGNCNETLNELFITNRYVFQQYTGLKDKNGKEIYEGDVVMRNTYTVKSGRPGMNGPYVIIWDAEKAGFDYSGEGYRSGVFYEVHEVIGNIYENPDLLQGNE